ncbi:hypothetical protein DFP72DRAFT_1113617 [Ephemerocybe angulata]|uniref:Uncharacterized protein n=1 Tax=Ephemerocybe angulata TaxID=980116 RepID=A0A8H6LUH8_9AGAR|nr:hypothetical protein DFP72DRAFT_1113617 [Tulosesus angulatus]
MSLLAAGYPSCPGRDSQLLLRPHPDTHSTNLRYFGTAYHPAGMPYHQGEAQRPPESSTTTTSSWSHVLLPFPPAFSPSQFILSHSDEHCLYIALTAPHANGCRARRQSSTCRALTRPPPQSCVDDVSRRLTSKPCCDDVPSALEVKTLAVYSCLARRALRQPHAHHRLQDGLKPRGIGHVVATHWSGGLERFSEGGVGSTSGPPRRDRHHRKAVNRWLEFIEVVLRWWVVVLHVGNAIVGLSAARGKWGVRDR